MSTRRARSRTSADSSSVPTSPAAALRTTLAVVSPVALITALLYYFGWVRVSTQAQALGYDATIVGLTDQSYVVRSIAVLFYPLLTTILAAIAGFAVHRAVLRRATRSSRWRERTIWFGTALTWSWPVWLGMCGGFLAVPALRPAAVPVTLTATCLSVLYGGLLVGRLSRRELDKGIRGCVLALLALALFWDTERLARAWGEGDAGLISAGLKPVPDVTVYSTTALNLTGIEPSTVPSGAYRFRYHGLRLLHYTADRYVLTGATGQAADRVYVLRDRPAVRFELSRPPGARAGPPPQAGVVPVR
ncbi:hypothetical protein [Cryptosporangium arvum]|uniref:Uncharacterized protein n=1 Tax=Cryptosporangium arvum DSM 44712 TaxID=927661 RepID=A0A011AL60_9ACTN|nr:hypothetical protein [Cryptosporangium arvum]EXG82686.1 hypothetical protein CryarDRAFT_3886 [Cryptosporangium arvum DSM 44712]